ncbi:hypothetical protein [Mesorhizobium sp.]|uniref:hypothetical protein n=1 Tax=Mesorhizobium sp. TaxID=1871066 RepID=UPI000FE84212|nr:hypothetical protein [Mesorhizobium sp.]RWK58325.1 MAG: hypothetical protein EOR49_31875 [Mesorhizobium sp.]RWM42223.1 MAG: hypothetical protein EOR76_33295 [Mesorhizobium sp.]
MPIYSALLPFSQGRYRQVAALTVGQPELLGASSTHLDLMATALNHEEFSRAWPSSPDSRFAPGPGQEGQPIALSRRAERRKRRQSGLTDEISRILVRPDESDSRDCLSWPKARENAAILNQVS